MKRREFIGALAGLAGTAIVGCTLKENEVIGNKKGKKHRWKLSMAVPKTLPIWAEGIINFSKRVKMLSGGRLDIKVYGANELIPGLGVFDAVKNGTIEMGHSASYYWQGKIPASVFFTAIPFGMDANGMAAWMHQGGGQKLWDELYAPHQIKPFPCGNTGMQMGGWFRKEINRVEDFKGLKMRMPGLGGKVITRLGASAETLAVSEIYQSLSTGVLDATEWVGPFHDYIMGFYKASKYYYSIGWQEPGPVLELLINKKAWESLDEELKLIVEVTCAQVDRDMFVHWLAKDAEFYERIKKEKKVQLRFFPSEVIKVLQKEAKEVIEEVRRTSPLAGRIYNSFFSFKKRYETYANFNKRAFIKAIDMSQ